MDGDFAASKLEKKTSSIAVLPFANLSADKENEYFSDGLSEEILNALSQVEGLNVAARTSSFSFKGKTVEINEIAARLQVANVLEGSVRRAGNRIRITVQLVDARNGFQLWSERYDRQMEDIFDVQDENSTAIAGRLKVTLGVGGKPSTKNIEASSCTSRAATTGISDNRLQSGKASSVSNRLSRLIPSTRSPMQGSRIAMGSFGHTAGCPRKRAGHQLRPP